MTLESQYGVPTVAFHTHVFEKVVRSVTRVNGMPRMRFAFVPQPVMGKSPRELRAYVDGSDAITGRPVMQEVIEGLTRPFDAEDLRAAGFERSTPRLVEPDTEALGPYNHPNATIGRAYGLLSQNGQGGSVPGVSYMGSQGNGYMYNSLTFAENEERSPWVPFHVQHGFQPTDSTVSVFTGCR